MDFILNVNIKTPCACRAQVAALTRRQDARLALLAVQAALGLGARPPLPPGDLVTAGRASVRC